MSKTFNAQDRVFFTTLGEVVQNCLAYPWDRWVQIQRPVVVEPATECVVLDLDVHKPELSGFDEDTGIFSSDRGVFVEFLSIADIQSCAQYCDNVGAKGDEDRFFAVQHYYKNDAYPREETFGL